MIELAILQATGLLSITTIAVLLIIFGWREFRLSKKIELLKHIIDKGYETENVNINDL